MKWEILKGSEKDFEGTPQWAAQIERSTVSGSLFFTESILGSQNATDRCMWSGEGIVRPLNHSANHDSEWFEVIAERRPITEPDVNQQVTKEWDGEGLPPVGVECEMLWDKEWVKCVIKAYGDEQFIFKAQGHREWAGHINNFEFRPIRSPEDAARDKAIHAMASSHKPCGHATAGICADIYDSIASGNIPGVKLE